ncbi:MAG: peptidase M3 [Telmatospirillum sp.]|nr:peptidase M3 [Telmatospirillum sp.]
MDRIRAAFDRLNQDYLAVHTAKEELFWQTYMAVSDDHAAFAEAETAYKAFISDPARRSWVDDLLGRLEGLPEAPGKEELGRGLKGWKALFACNSVETEEAKSLQADLIAMEAALFAKRASFQMMHVTEAGRSEEATLSSATVNLGTNPDRVARKSSHDALMGLERWVLDNGFPDIVAKRNALARALGYATYFDYKVAKNERMTTAQLFAILEDFEVRTRDANSRTLDALVAEQGAEALAPFNLRFHMSGGVVRRMDPYLPFSKALDRWVESFRRLGITYRGAVLQLDLLERKGKYQNGFCHGPVPAFFDGDGRWVAGHINFTAEGRPDQVGSGARAIKTLFHEGGHAAHFANVTGNAPCFSQEFPPTSMAYAETQSMFCDSLLEDGDWLKLYAVDDAGNPIPDELIRAQIEATQPFRAFQERSILVVPYFERALYAMSDEERTPDAVLALARSMEQRILGVSPSPRPLLAIPHLLNQESAASYHGYLLANMAVYQTRAHFLKTFGYLTDNPRIGPLLARHYWAPGNSVSHDATLRSLTGEGFGARYLAEVCNRTVDDAWSEAAAAIAAAEIRPRPPLEEFPSLDATIRIVDGADLLADNHRSETAMCEAFSDWIAAHYPAAGRAIMIQ